MTRLTQLQGGISGIGSRKPRLTRNWVDARAKCDAQGCRICGEPAEAAHIISRSKDAYPPINWQGEWNQRKLLVWPERICPLCPREHRLYDSGDLDLLPCLTEEEQAQAVKDAGGVYPMLWRTMASENPRRAA